MSTSAIDELRELAAWLLENAPADNVNARGFVTLKQRRKIERLAALLGETAPA